VVVAGIHLGVDRCTLLLPDTHQSCYHIQLDDLGNLTGSGEGGQMVHHILMAVGPQEEGDQEDESMMIAADSRSC